MVSSTLQLSISSFLLEKTQRSYTTAQLGVASCMLLLQQHLCVSRFFWPSDPRFLLAKIQNRLVDHRVGPVVSEIIQVIVKVNQILIGSALQQGRCDLLSLTPVFKCLTITKTMTDFVRVYKDSKELTVFFFAKVAS